MEDSAVKGINALRGISVVLRECARGMSVGGITNSAVKGINAMMINWCVLRESANFVGTMNNPAVKKVRNAMGAGRAVLLIESAIAGIRANPAVTGINAMKVRAVLVIKSAIQNK